MDDSQPQCIGWIQTIFGECITSQQAAWSLLMGYASIFCWLNAQIPQIIENFKLGSADSLSLPFLINWLLGDLSNLLGCVLTKQLPFQLYLAIYFCIADVILFSQWIYYSRQERKLRSLPDMIVAALPEISEHSRRQSRRGTAHGTPRRESFAPPHEGMVLDATEMEAGDDAMAPMLPRPRTRRPTTASDLAHRRSTSLVLFGLMLLTMRQTLPSLGTGPTSSALYGQDARATIGRIVARDLPVGDVDMISSNGMDPEQGTLQLGRIFAWVCTVFYLSSRMPQLWKNYTRKSVQGLSILMFFWAAMGNFTYTLSVLNSEGATNPDTRHQVLLEAVPYVLGSSGTLLFDVSIFVQWLYYSGKFPFYKFMWWQRRRQDHHHQHDHDRHHHHRRSARHRHYHPRQRSSRGQSRPDSMAMSPSGSTGGLYNMVASEDDLDVIERASIRTLPRQDLDQEQQQQPLVDMNENEMIDHTRS